MVFFGLLIVGLNKKSKYRKLGSRQILQFFFINLHGPYLKKKKKNLEHMLQADKRISNKKANTRAKGCPENYRWRLLKYNKKDVLQCFLHQGNYSTNSPVYDVCKRSDVIHSIACLNHVYKQLLQGGRVSSEISRAFWL
jgi:hypothetical protein